MTFRALCFALLLSFSTVASASWNQGYQTETGGNGFRVVKIWGGSAGTLLRIEYYGYLAERCNAGSGSGHRNHLNFFVRLNGKLGQFQETSCGVYGRNGVPNQYAIVEVRSNDGQSNVTGGVMVPWFFEGIDNNSTWNLDIYVQAITGEYDSRYGRNYQFSL